MADDKPATSRQQGLQQAASVIFALIAIVPLLIFTWTVHALGAISGTQAQLTLGLALAVALLGFCLFRALLRRVTDVLRAVAVVVEQSNRTRPPAAAVTLAEPAPATRGGNGTAAPASMHAMAGLPPRPPASSVAPQTRTVPGIGRIRELSEVVRMMDTLWYREAAAHVGERVQISVANGSEPLIGTLSEATGDGLILEQDDGQVAIAYGRVTAIDRLS